jgi:hypothetical protein
LRLFICADILAGSYWRVIVYVRGEECFVIKYLETPIGRSILFAGLSCLLFPMEIFVLLSGVILIVQSVRIQFYIKLGLRSRSVSGNERVF